ncbi:MAG TPA: tetratricopeptide repeat protein, partial [Thermoanaerobaculia bacterium]|nr:tetratricopeptide repeat protein [Thermoanaerobaculia bacterium]
ALRRALGLWLVLVAAYAATLGIDATGGAPLAPAEARVLLGGLYVDDGRAARALEVLAPLTGSNPARPDLPHPAALFVAARAEMSLGNAARAEELLVESAERAPRSRAAVLLAAVRTSQERHAEAAELLAPVWAAVAEGREDPGFTAEIALHYGRTLVALGRRAEAVPLLARATELTPGSIEAWRLLGESLVDLGRVDEARAALGRLRELEEAAHAAAVAGSGP